MSCVPQYLNRNIAQRFQSSTKVNYQPSNLQLQQNIQNLKSQLKQKQSTINELTIKIKEKERILEEKQFLIQEKQLQLQYIHKQNEELHEKIFKLNQKLNEQRADIKNTIKNEVSMLKEEFNFMIKQNQTKNEIILQQKEKQFKRKEQELNAAIRDLSERAQSHCSSSFFYQGPQTSILNNKNMPLTLLKRVDNNFEKEEEKNSTANSNLKNSRQSFRSNQLQNRVLNSLRGSKADDGFINKGLIQKKTGQHSFSNILLTDSEETDDFEFNQVGTGRFGEVHRHPILIKNNLKRLEQNKHQLSKTTSKTKIEEIINRSKRQLWERNKKASQTNLTKYSSKPSLTSYGRNTKVDQSLNLFRNTDAYRLDPQNQKSKLSKMREISSLKMKVNMLKSQLQDEITFCQHKQ